MRTFLLLAALCAAASPAAADVVFKSHGLVVRYATTAELAELVPPQVIRIWEPHEKKEEEFKAFPVEELFAKIYGADWKKSEEALFTCTDGFQPSLPTAEFSRHKGYLAFARADGSDFSAVNPDSNEKVALGPFYLVWDNIHDASIREQGTIPGWPYEVSSVDLIRFADRFPHMAPPAGSSAAATRGFLQFRKRCLSCHTVNGEGGMKGVELNYPANPTEYWKADWLRRWITDPKSVRFNTDMHPFDRDNADWEKDRDDVIAYLQAMSKAKQRPEEPKAP